MAILFYDPPYYVFSNWSAHMVEYKGILYTTAEHAYHVQKFTDEEVKRQIRKSKSPMEAKAVAHLNRDKEVSNWDDIKVAVMEEIVMQKALQHQEVRDILLATGDEEIVEDSPDDYFWGIGKDGTGENQMGKIWMRVRLALL